MAPVPSRLWVPCQGERRPVGTHVRRGQGLCDAPTAPPAPVDGVIVGFSDAAPLGRSSAPAVILKASQTELTPPRAVSDPQVLRQMLRDLPSSQSEFALHTLQSAGVQADRWTSPDLIEQLRQAAGGRKISAVLCNALDLDPVLPLQRTVLVANALEIFAASAALGRLLGVQQTILAVAEDTPTPQVAVLRSAAQLCGVRLYAMPDEYPLAHPSLLVRHALGRRVAPGRLPSEGGVVLLDAAAALAAGQALLWDRPMSCAPFGVYERGAARATLLWAATGSRVGDVLTSIDVPWNFSELRPGHILRELQANGEAIVGPGELTLFVAQPAREHDTAACLRCGWCVDACPPRVHPAGLLEAAQQHDMDLAERYGLRSCIECGICTYVCPARLPLLESIRSIDRP